MGVPEARLNRSRKGSRLCLNSTRLKGDVITLPDSAPSSPEMRCDKDLSSFEQHARKQERSQMPISIFQASNSSPTPPVAPVSSFYNLGNTCFMNCMLHVLRYTPGLVPLLAKLSREVELEEKLLAKEESELSHPQGRQGWQLLRSLHDVYTEMSEKEAQHKASLPTSTGAMSLRPYVLLDSIRDLNPLFEGNMQHDAQELLRCLLCGLDDAELELRRIRKNRDQVKQEASSTDKDSGTALKVAGSTTHGDVKREECASSASGQKITTATSSKLPSLKGGRRRVKKRREEEVTAASKGFLASFLKGQEVPAITTKVDEPRCEPIEGVGLGKESDVGSGQDVDPMKSLMAATQIPDQANPYEGASGIASRCFGNSSSSLPSSRDPSDAGFSLLSTSSSRVDDGSLTDVIRHGDSCSSSLSQLGSSSSSSSLTLGHDTNTSYLMSVKNTEGRRSRLGVRGKAKMFPNLNDNNNCDSLSNSPSVSNDSPLRGENPSLPVPIVIDDKEIDDTEKRDSLETKENNFIDLTQDDSQEFCSLSSGKPCTQRLFSLKTSMSREPLTDSDEIVECPASDDTSELSPNQRSKKGRSASPQCDDKDTQNITPSSSPTKGGSSSVLLLTPGKEITIHSPISRNLAFYTPPVQRSDNLLSRLGHFIPNSARRFLSFSSQDPPPSKASLLKTDLQQTALEDRIPKDESFGFPQDKQLTPVEVRECVQKAKVQLKRCDWLGVSPVKSVSARYVIKRILNSEPSGPPCVEKMESLNGDLKRDASGKPLLTSTKQSRKRSCPGESISPSAGDTLKDEASSSRLNNFETGSGSGQVPRAKRFKGSPKSATDADLKHEGVAVGRKGRLPRLSIKLEKCDWLMHCGGKSVKLSTVEAGGEGKGFGAARSTVKSPPPSNISSLSSSLVHVKFEKSSSSGADSLKPALEVSGDSDQSLAYRLFGGTMSHQTRCCECESITDRSEEFLDISIPVPKQNSSYDGASDDEDTVADEDPVSLLLQSLTSRERIYGENKYLCDKCHHLVEAERSSHVTLPPKVLALHLKRFHANSSALGGVSKINDHVTVPLSLPCLLDQCPGDKQPSGVCNHGYELYAVVTHSGASIRHGHYRTYVRVPAGFNKFAETDGSSKLRSRNPESPCTPRDVPSSDLPELPGADPFGISISSSSLLPKVESSPLPCPRRGQDGNQGVQAKDLTSSISVFKQSSDAFVVAECGDGDGDDSSSWWLECDDDYISVFDEDEFFGKLSQTDGCLLGTPYVLFYHQSR